MLEYILSGETLASLGALAEKQPARLRYPDALWVSTVYEFLLAYRSGVMRREHIVQALAPLVSRPDGIVPPAVRHVPARRRWTRLSNPCVANSNGRSPT